MSTKPMFCATSLHPKSCSDERVAPAKQVVINNSVITGQTPLTTEVLTTSLVIIHSHWQPTVHSWTCAHAPGLWWQKIKPAIPSCL